MEPVGPGTYGVMLSQYYTIAGHPNGGYLQCVMANAALAAALAEGSNHLHATAVATNYSGVPEVGPAELRTDVRRVGRGVSFVHVTLSQGGHVTTESLGHSWDVARLRGALHGRGAARVGRPRGVPSGDRR